MAPRVPIRPDRIRRIAGQTFAFVPHRFLRGGFFSSLSADERSLYLFLVLAADRDGVSFYGYDRICSTLELCLDDYIVARNRLIDADLIAFDGTRFQVLSLPDHPVRSPAAELRGADDFDDRDPATIRRLLRDSFPGDDGDAP